MSFHSQETAGSIHIIYQWTYADETARTSASGFAASDIGKVARQLSDETYWLLTDNDPATWAALAGGGAVTAHALGGASHTADTLANLNSKISDATLDDISGTRKSVSADAEGEATGFEDPESDITISWSDGSKELTVAPTGASFNLWQRGVKYTKTSEVKSISGVIVEGFWFFYYDSSGVLQASQSAWSFDSHAPVAVIYWDNVNSKALAVWWEPHRITMDWATHKYLHTTINTRFRTGLGTSGITDGDGSLNTHAQVEVGSGGVSDEDLDINITQGTGGGRFEQDLALPAKIPVWYLDGSTPVWRVKTANSYPLLEGTTRIKYNQYSAPNWLQTEVGSNNYHVATWLFATSDQTQPIIAILGQRTDQLLVDAQDNNTLGSLNLAGLGFQEMKVIARLIFQTSAVYGNAPRARLKEILDLRTTSDLPAGSFTATTHNSLSGRDDPNCHPASAISATTTTFDGGLSSADSDVQTALETIDDKLLSKYAERTTSLAHTGDTNWTEVLSLSTGSIPAGDYIAYWYVFIGINQENNQWYIRSQVDNTTNLIDPGGVGYVTRTLPKGNGGARMTLSGFRKVTLSAASHTVDIDMQLSNTGDTITAYQASIFLRRI